MNQHDEIQVATPSGITIHIRRASDGRTEAQVADGPWFPMPAAPRPLAATHKGASHYVTVGDQCYGLPEADSCRLAQWMNTAATVPAISPARQRLNDARERLDRAEADDYHDPAAIIQARQAAEASELAWREACPEEALLRDAESLRQQAADRRRQADDAARYTADGWLSDQDRRERSALMTAEADEMTRKAGELERGHAGALPRNAKGTETTHQQRSDRKVWTTGYEERQRWIALDVTAFLYRVGKFQSDGRVLTDSHRRAAAVSYAKDAAAKLLGVPDSDLHQIGTRHESATSPAATAARENLGQVVTISDLGEVVVEERRRWVALDVTSFLGRVGKVRSGGRAMTASHQCAASDRERGKVAATAANDLAGELLTLANIAADNDLKAVVARYAAERLDSLLLPVPDAIAKMAAGWSEIHTYTREMIQTGADAVAIFDQMDAAIQAAA